MSYSYFIQFDTPTSLPSMSTRLLTSLKLPFSKSKQDSSSSQLPEPSREPAAVPPSYEEIIMGLHLSRTPHIPAHLAHLYPPQSQPRLHRELSSSPTPTSITTTSISSVPAPCIPHRVTLKPRSQSLRNVSSSQSSSHSRPRVRLPPPPARSAMKKPRKRPESVNSSVTPDTASGSTVSSSVAHPSTPTRHTSRLLTRFLRPNKERRVHRQLLRLSLSSLRNRTGRNRSLGLSARLCDSETSQRRGVMMSFFCIFFFLVGTNGNL
ncbi:hypothetical protein BGW80DRAFT_61159 [Lactifluus volemus]|nr:hypothetical protein BGW80DRAFT_61159 [Lactifluus volemus]